MTGEYDDDNLDGLETGGAIQTGGERQARMAEIDPIEERARADGWKPEAEWRGDKSKWQPAERFVLRGSARRKEVDDLRAQLDQRDRQTEERLMRLAKASETAIQRVTEQRIEAIRAAKEQAGIGGDVKAYRELERAEDAERASAAKLADEVRPTAAHPAKPNLPAETTEWIARNQWFERDADLRTEALDAYNKARKAATLRGEQLREADLLRAVDEHFDTQYRKPASGQRQQQREYMPDMEGGASSRRLDGGGRQLPPEAVKAGRAFIAKGVYTNMDEYAKDYWEGE